jgi:hypothetical protein
MSESFPGPAGAGWVSQPRPSQSQLTPTPASATSVPPPPAVPGETDYGRLVFGPSPASPPSPPENAAYKEQAYVVLSHYHGIHGRLDILVRRLGELLAAHAALITHVVAEAGDSPRPADGSTGFWEEMLGQHHVIHGMLQAAETDAAGILRAHGDVIAALETL